MYNSSYTQTLQDQIGQLSKLLGAQGSGPPALQEAPPAAQAANQFDCVSGLDGAKAFLGKMISGTKHIVWDNDKPVFYILQKDANGSPQRVQICNFTVELEPTPEERFVTKEDFNALLSRLDGILKKEDNDG